MSSVFQEKMLSHISGFSTGVSTFYQKPANKTTVVTNITIVNTNTAASTYSIYFNNSAATFGTTHLVFPLQTISPNNAVSYTDKWFLGNTLSSFGWLAGTTGIIAWMWGCEVQD